MRLGIFLGVLALAPAARAWEAKCYLDEAGAQACSESDAGPMVARSHWLGEHAYLAGLAFVRAGLPEDLLEAREISVYTDGGDVEQVGDPEPAVPEVPSWQPADLDEVEAKVTHQRPLAQFAELPDMSFSFQAWLGGNEVCPLPGAPANPLLCYIYGVDYSFALLRGEVFVRLGYIGPVNSTHFSPQAGAMHAHYHAIAMDIAAQCASMREALGDDWEDPRFLPYLMECDWLAMALEGVGQHFLQDVWSSGHMWHRWGSPYLDQVGGTVRGGIVAAIVGIIHGAKSFVPEADDPLCFPTEHVRWLDASGALQRGVGDIFVSDLVLVPTFTAAKETLLDCSAAHYAAVYQAGARSYGPASPAAFAYGEGDERCYAPRVTNAAFAEGLDLRYDENRRVPIVPAVAALTFFLPDIEGVLDVQARADLVGLAFTAHVAASVAPNVTSVATNTDGLLGTLMGVGANETFLGEIPASYHDPLPPYSVDRIHAQVFRKAHAPQWCTEVGLAEIGRLAARCADVPADEQAEHGACGLCKELAIARFRDGCSASDPDLDPARDGICARIVEDPDAAELLYLPLDDMAGETPEQRVEAFCTGADRERAQCDRTLVVDRGGGRLIGLSNEDGFAVDFVIPTGARSQRVAITPAGMPLAVVTSESDGTVALIDLGAGRELDWDDDPETTDPGLEAGMTRVPAPGARGVAITPDGRHALVASSTTNVLTVLDLLARRVVALVPLPDDHADSVAIGLGGTKAYVTLSGTIQDPDNRIAVIDVTAAVDGVDGNDPVGLIEHVGSDSRVSRLSVAPDDQRVAVALPGLNRVGVIDMVADDIVDLWPEQPERQFIQTDYPMTDVAWSADGEAIYVVEVTSEGPNGSLRRVVPGDNRLGPAVAVGNSPRAISVSPSGTRAYVVNGDNTMTVLDPEAGAVVDTVRFADLFLEVTPSDVVSW